MPRRPYDARHPHPGVPPPPAPLPPPHRRPAPLPSHTHSLPPSPCSAPSPSPLCLRSTSLTASDLTASPHRPNGIFASDAPIDVDAAMEDELREKEDGSPRQLERGSSCTVSGFKKFFRKVFLYFFNI
uniref:Uncharacterized protein n=1 Tax=Zea mays TaxID=4577 RepID=A0A804NVT7_MAIZE